MVSATLSGLKWSGAIFHPRSSKISVQKVLSCSFHCKPRPSGVSLDCSGLENIAQVRGNRAEFCQNHDARKAVSATLWFLKWTGAIFRPRSSKGKVQKVLLCPFHRKPSHISRFLQCPGHQNIPQVPRNRAEVCQHHDARKAVSVTLLVLKWRGCIFRSSRSKVSVQKVLLSQFNWKPGHHELV